MEEPSEALAAAIQQDNEAVSGIWGSSQNDDDNNYQQQQQQQQQRDNQDNDKIASDENLLPTAEVCRIIRENMQNMERSLRCPLCLSCYHDAHMISACCHVYCRTCIITALQIKKECPTCKQSCTKRGLTAAQQFDQLVRAYKKMLRNFGLAPARFDPNIPITQLPPDEEDDEEEEEEDPGQDENMQPHKQTYHQSNNNANSGHDAIVGDLTDTSPSNVNVAETQQLQRDSPRRKRLSLDWIHLHEHVQAARTFARHLSGTAGLQKEQAAVVSTNERALVQAAVARQHAKVHARNSHHNKGRQYQYQDISLSQQIRENAQEQQAADALLSRSLSLEVNHGGSAEFDISDSDSDSANLNIVMEEEQDNCKPAARDTQQSASQESCSEPEPLSVETRDTTPAESLPLVSDHRNDDLMVDTKVPTSAAPASSAIAIPSVTDLVCSLARRAAQHLPSPTSSNKAKEQSSPRKSPPRPSSTPPLVPSPPPPPPPPIGSVSRVIEARGVDDAEESDVAPEKATDPFEEETLPIIEAAPASEVLHNDNVSSVETAPPTAKSPARWLTHSKTPPFLGGDEEEIQKSMPAAKSQDSTYIPPCAGLDENSPSRTLRRRPDYFSVGTIVEVQSRTWPGVNKHGGVGRVARVHHQENDNSANAASSIFYDIAYVLGGKESMVDAVFVSPYNRPLGRDQDAGSLRLRFNNIPQSLLAQLEAEGFDTVGRPSLAMFHNSKTSERIKENTKPPPMPCSPRNRHSDGFQEGMFPLSPSRAVNQKQRLRSSFPSRTTNALLRKRSRSEDGDQFAELVNDRAKCQRADEHYEQVFAEAIKKGVVNVVTSSLSRQEAEGVVTLCKSTKGAPVKVRLSESLSKKTTVCIMPLQKDSAPLNTTASCRTLKSMRAALAGVPVVGSKWVNTCLQAGQFMHPSPSLYIRTLPSKVGNGVTDYGVAYIAALIRLGSSHKALKSCFVYLCGKYSGQVENDMLLLAREAGGTVLTQPQTVPSKIKAEKSKVVLLCNKTADESLTETLSSEIKQHPQNVLVVTAQWLFDSVSSGRCQDARAYPPEPDCEQAKGLWTITSTAQDFGQTGFFGTTSL